MRKRRLQRQHGQGLAEYALLLALVAIVAIIVLGLLGWAAQGMMGLVVGVLNGPGGNSASSSHLTIVSVKCQPGVKIEVDISTTYPASELTLRNDAADWFWDGVPSNTHIVSGLAPDYSCPRAVVVQHRTSGNIAAAGVEQVKFE
jgi:Flp pilus assembly pilin Flp